MEIYREERKPSDDRLYPFDIHIQSQFGPGEMAAAHYHDYIEILYCQSGAFEAQLGGRQYTFSGGDMVLIHTQEVHRIAGVGRGSNEYVVVKFNSGLLFSPEQTAMELKYLLAFTLGFTMHQRIFRRADLERSNIPTLIPEILREHTLREYGYEIAIRAGLCGLFLWILRQWHRVGVEISLVTDVSVSDMNALQRVFDYVECRYADKIGMEQVAGMLNMSYSAFSKFFALHTHKNFSDYLNEVRITKSKILLATTDKNMTEIAMETGFSTTSYFIQCFKSRLGVTPRRFRHQFILPQPAQ